MILRNSDLQSVSDLDSIRNSCDVSFKSSHIYFDYLTVLDLSKKGGGHPPTHHPPQGRILTTFRLFFVARCGQRGRILTNFRLFFVAGGGGLKSALFT